MLLCYPSSMSGIRLVLLVVSFLWLPVVSCSEVADSPRPTHGARIAEPEAGTWTWLCAVSVQGAEYAESSAKGSGVGSTREAARTVAVRDACAKAGGGKSCENASVGWELGSARKQQRRTIRSNSVKIDVRDPPGPPVRWIRLKQQLPSVHVFVPSVEHASSWRRLCAWIDG